jgi:hypothetical protein
MMFFTKRFLVTNLNNGDSSAVVTPLLSGKYSATGNVVKFKVDVGRSL